MKYSVEFTTGARQDLFKIYRYIKDVGRPEIAKKFSEQIAAVCSSLAENPERGHVPTELEGLSDVLCRQLVHKNYRIIYQVIGHVVILQGIIDGRRNVSEVLRQRILI
jgi:plasmid stabilization system protein ParE